MLVSLCLFGSNLNIHAKPEKLKQQQYNWHLNLSPKHQDPDLQVKQLAMKRKNGNFLQSSIIIIIIVMTMMAVVVAATT
jgi:hypothetical protein